MMKKLLCLFVACCMVFGLIACGAKNEPEATPAAGNDVSGETQAEATPEATPEYIPDMQGRNIRIMAWWVPGPPERGVTEVGDLFADKVENMESKYNFKFEYINEPMDLYLSNYSASIVSGEPMTDFGYVQVGMFFPAMVASNMLYPVSDLPYFDFTESKWTPMTIASATYKGKVYGFSTGKADVRGLLFFNKTLFEKNDLPDLYELQRNKQWTWDKFLECAQRLTKDTDNDGVTDIYGIVNRFTALETDLIFSNNGKTVVFDDNGYPKLAVDDANTIEALQFLQELYVKHKVVNVPPENAYLFSPERWQYGIDSFGSGVDGMLTGEMWMADSFRDSMEDDYGIVMFPMGPKADDYVSIAGDCVFVTMPFNVTDPENLSFIWDAYTDPLPEQTEADWLAGFESSVRDEESLESIRMISERSFLDNMILFTDVYFNSYDYFNSIENGSKTPANFIEEFASYGQTIIDDAMRAYVQD